MKSINERCHMEQITDYKNIENGICVGYQEHPKSSEAISWFKKMLDLAEQKGTAQEQNLVGNCYYNGYGVQRDYEEAVMWYLEAASQGYAAAQKIWGSVIWRAPE